MRHTLRLSAPLLHHATQRELVCGAEAVLAASPEWQAAPPVHDAGDNFVRTGVVRRSVDLPAERARLAAMVSTGDRVREAFGTDELVGVDEAGRGCWAGHVCAAAVHIPCGVAVEGVKDSKRLSAKHRVWVYRQLLAHPDVIIAVDLRSPAQIDETNVLAATRDAMRSCVAHVHAALKARAAAHPAVVLDGTSLVDGRVAFSNVPKQFAGQFAGLQAVECHKGDDHHLPVAAASIIAKTLRDATMHDLDAAYPSFGFLAHKAYGTARHQEALQRHGPITGVHRRSFRPMKNMDNWVAAAA